MNAPATALLLWTGPRHSGKTTAAAALAGLARQRGLRVAGLLAPARYAAGRLGGFDAEDLRTGARAPLARRGADGPQRVGEFAFLSEGLTLGAGALSQPATRRADLVIVDEFGPLELTGQGWRDAVDRLVRSHRAVVVLVVRDGMIDAVKRLYAESDPRVIRAADPDAAEAVLKVLQGPGR